MDASACRFEPFMQGAGMTASVVESCEGMKCGLALMCFKTSAIRQNSDWEVLSVSVHTLNEILVYANDMRLIAMTFWYSIVMKS